MDTQIASFVDQLADVRRSARICADNICFLSDKRSPNYSDMSIIKQII